MRSAQTTEQSEDSREALLEGQRRASGDDASGTPDATPLSLAHGGSPEDSGEHGSSERGRAQACCPPVPASERPAPKTTVQCYEFWDRVFRRAGLLDYTEGYYNGDPAVPYEEAQRRQLRYLLDEVGCRAGSRILEIGCGNGTLLDEVRERGARGVGVTISPWQVQFCRQRGLDVRLLNYRDIPDDWVGQFDAVVANGCMEHFVQPRDAQEGRADEIYQNFFRIAHRAIDPRSESRRLVNTTIHFRTVQFEPRDAVRSPWVFRWGSDRFHCAMLARGFGGFYPSLGQLQRCATGLFRLLHERDATEDYRLTSEEWLRYGKRSLWTFALWRDLLPFALRHPGHSATMLLQLLVSQSWNWQFRGQTPPMKHLWQTWEFLA